MKTKRKGVYQILTDQIIGLLEKGTIPWKQPWAKKEVPQNLINRIPFRGINMMLLSAFNFERNFFLTYKQLKSIGASIKEGEKPFPVIFWKWPEKGKVVVDPEMLEASGNSKVIPILRYYTVYNISQCQDIPQSQIPPLLTRANDPIEACVRVVNFMPERPTIQSRDHRAYYNPALDIVNVPGIQFFDSSENYYATLFHELIHATGHKKRLDRKEGMESISFGSNRYSKEELIAELGACFLEAYTGISEKNLKNNAAYIGGWIEKLKNDCRFIVFASAKAQKATDYILNNTKNDLESQPIRVPVSTEA